MALGTLPWLGFVPDKVSSAPLMAAPRLADHLRVDQDDLRSHGRRAKTRTERLRLVAKPKELDEFLLARALENDSPTLLFRLAGDYSISARALPPGAPSRA